MLDNNNQTDVRTNLHNQLKYAKAGDYNSKGGISKLVTSTAKEFASIEESHRDKLYLIYCKVYEQASMARANTDVAAEFCRDSIWEDEKSKPHTDKPNEYLRHMFRVTFGLGKSSTRKRASKVSIALAKAWQGQIPPFEIMEYLVRNGGVEGLLKTRATKRARKKKKQLKKSPVKLDFFERISCSAKKVDKLKKLEPGKKVKATLKRSKDGRSLSILLA